MQTLDEYKAIEAKRRLTLLGETASLKDYDYSQLVDRAQVIRIPVKVFIGWWREHHAKGLDGLIPLDWQELEMESLQIALDRFILLGVHIDDDVLTPEITDEITARSNWKWRTLQRWIERYRVGGLWGLAPGKDPQKRHKAKEKPPRDIGILDDDALREIYRRFDMIEPLAKNPTCTQDEVEARAKEVGVSARTLWNYLAAYRKYGLAGLAPRERADA